MRDVARELGVVIPVSFFERAGQAYYNSVAIVDADGAVLGVYRKSHIPDGPGYEEKFYFRPGDTGFRVWETRFGALGVGICWDQWFPESARAMMLLGAEVLLYPTAIGSEPHEPDLDTRDPWQRAMMGHAVSNVVPVVAANRIGVEGGQTLLRLVVHRRPPRRQGRRARPRRRGRDRWPPSTSTHCAHARRLGLLPRPPAGPLRRADHGGRAPVDSPAGEGGGGRPGVPPTSVLRGAALRFACAGAEAGPHLRPAAPPRGGLLAEEERAGGRGRDGAESEWHARPRGEAGRKRSCWMPLR